MGIALKSIAARWALTACAACLVSCSPTEKIRVYTAFSDVAFLNDTLAALIVVDATEKEAALGSAYIEHSELSVYLLPFARGGAIARVGRPVVFNSVHAPELLPWIAGRDLLLADRTSPFSALVTEGAVLRFDSDSCCVKWAPGPDQNEFIYKTIHGGFFLKSKDAVARPEPLDPDAIFGRHPTVWYDITVHEGAYLAAYRDSSAFFLASRAVSGAPGETRIHPIPGIGERDLGHKVFFIPGYDVLMKTPLLPFEGSVHAIDSILAGSPDSVWKAFAPSHSPDGRTEFVRIADSLVFQSLEKKQILTGYDLTRYLKKNQ